MTLDIVIFIILSVFVSPTSAVSYAMSRADIPTDQRGEYAFMVYCESRWDTYATGDSGSAKGLLQIHEEPWVAWGEEQAGESFNNLHNPVKNLRLAYLINEIYDRPRNGRWSQWRYVNGELKTPRCEPDIPSWDSLIYQER